MKKTGIKTILLFLSCLIGLYGFAQQKTVSGMVLNGADKSPVPGASITVKGSKDAVISGADGSFSLTVSNEDAILVISSIGFETAEISVSGRNAIEVLLKEKADALEEVVVTGYTSQRKKDLTGAVAVVDVNQLKSQPVASPIEALQGKATGVTIINDGAPGSTPQIRIRGFSTINNNDPLYIIDGMPYEGKLSWLGSSDIESMQVLKDASAASIYGARANNGVVIITTKKGKKGPPLVTFDTYYGTQRPNRSTFPKFLNPQQYAEYFYQAFRNAGLTPGLGETTGENYGSDPNTPVIADYLVAGPKRGHQITAADADPSKYKYSMDPDEFYQITRANKEGTNWFDEITTNAPIQNYQLSVSGAGDNSNYAISGGYLRQDGTIKYTGFERYIIRANTSFDLLNKRVTLGQNMQYSYTKGVGFGVNPNTAGGYQAEGSPMGFAYRAQTVIPVYDIMGNFAGTRGDKLGNAENPLALLYRAKDNVNKSGQFFGSVFADIKILKDLKYRSTFGLRYENYNGLSIGYPNPEFAEGSFTRNSLSEYFGVGSEWTWTNILTYNSSFGDNHRLTALAGTEAIESTYRSVDGNGNDFFVAGDLNYYYLSTAAVRNSSSQGGFGALYSIFGKIDYSFKDRYLLSATLRRDGSSNFGPDNRFGLFPAASAAWRLSDEAFMQNVSWINELKLRVGYGVTGNQRIPSFQFLKRYQSEINYSFYPIGGANLASGLWTNSYDNVAIKWEEAKTINVGADFSLFNNTIEGSVEWFKRNTEGVLYPVPLPAAGVGRGASPFVNSGDIENKGIEIGLNYHYEPIASDDAFKFDVGVNFSKYTNKIIQLAPTVSEQPYLTMRGVTTSVLKAGAPLGAFYGYQVEGIFQDAADVQKGPTYDKARVGGFKFADLSGPDGVPDGVIDGFDRTVIGSPHPDFIYSINFNASYKRFDLVMFFNGSQGNDLFELTRQYTDLSAFDGGVSTRVLDAWSPTNTGSMMPSPFRAPGTREYESSSYYVQDGSFFRMRNLQIGYNFPTERLFKDRIKNLRAYISATNLFTLTKYTGLDPEVSQFSSTFTAPGVDMGIYPVPRQYLVGLSVTF